MGHGLRGKRLTSDSGCRIEAANMAAGLRRSEAWIVLQSNSAARLKLANITPGKQWWSRTFP